MAKPETGNLWQELTTARLYKRTQGLLARRLTAVALCLLVGVGAYTMSRGVLSGKAPAARIGLPIAVTVVAGWVIFRLINWPTFADFLISVEGEMKKVSWASYDELVRATIVVLSTMFFLGIVLFTYDTLWAKILSMIGVLQI